MQHPVIRVICLLLLATFLALGDNTVLLLCFIITLFLYVFEPPADFRTIIQIVFRMRWFFLSIFFVYIFLSPSTSFSSEPSAIFSSALAGMKRIIILILMMLLVTWLIKTTPRKNLITAIVVILKPFSLMGLAVDKFALRLHLVLQLVPEIQVAVKDKMSDIEIRSKGIASIGQAASIFFDDLINKIEQAPLTEVELEEQALPVFTQWMIPLMLFLVLLILQR